MAEPQDAGVNAWLMRASWPKLSAVMGTLICPFFVVLFRLRGDESWTAAIVMGGVVALIYQARPGITPEQVR